jgi:hypothetical protein
VRYSPLYHLQSRKPFIYSKNSLTIIERKICLDLGSSKPLGAKFIKAVVDQRFDTFDFETALSFVNLPPREFPIASGMEEKDADTLENYEPVFSFLKERKVRKIFKVIVNDLVGRPHTDEMIVSLVKEFGIEHWDWRKLDMNSETIREAAAEVKTVSLHSSGSFSALQGWACESGLVKLDHVST